jgi:hypothetical protein
MNKLLLIGLLVITQPLAAAPAPAPQIAESKLAQSSVSVMVDPQLNDGRLVLKVAAQNRGAAALTFGPSSISVSRPDGRPIALMSLQQLTDDVRLAAAMPPEKSSRTGPTSNAYSAPQSTIRDGKMDVTGYTGGVAVAGDEYLRGNKARSTQPTISKAEAEAQIAVLKQAILQDSSLQPGQVVAGQLVSEKLKFKKGEDRTLQLRIHVGAEEHGFTIEAPSK